MEKKKRKKKKLETKILPNDHTKIEIWPNNNNS